MERTIRWTKTAIRQLHAAIDYIRQDSVQNAKKVRLLILAKVDSLKKITWSPPGSLPEKQ